MQPPAQRTCGHAEPWRCAVSTNRIMLQQCPGEGAGEVGPAGGMGVDEPCTAGGQQQGTGLAAEQCRGQHRRYSQLEHFLREDAAMTAPCYRGGLPYQRLTSQPSPASLAFGVCTFMCSQPVTEREADAWHAYCCMQASVVTTESSPVSVARPSPSSTRRCGAIHAPAWPWCGCGERERGP
eukprot:365754-Chlamydomonas_euryale.AAC.12